MTPFIIDIVWLLFVDGLGWFILKKEGPEQRARSLSSHIIAMQGATTSMTADLLDNLSSRSQDRGLPSPTWASD
jgi:hypothetical protein